MIRKFHMKRWMIWAKRALVFSNQNGCFPWRRTSANTECVSSPQVKPPRKRKRALPALIRISGFIFSSEGLKNF
jgi:hypothetical protein